MCTPSVIWLAASVRLICSMISSSPGTDSNASACADLRSLARCSVSRKIRPLCSRSPSQTASPPWTAESNGLTAASSRCVSRPPTFTIRSRFRSSNCCSIAFSSDRRNQTVRGQFGVERLAARGQVFERGQAAAPGPRPAAADGAVKPVDAQTRAYQCFAQTPSVEPRPGGPGRASPRRTGSAARRTAPPATGAAARPMSAASITGPPNRRKISPAGPGPGPPASGCP